MYGPLLLRLEQLFERRYDLVDVANDAQIGDREDRRLAVLVDGEDVVAVLHADEVLGRAGDAEGDVELGLHGLAGLTHLQRVRNPAGIDDRAGRSPRALEHLGQLFDQGLVVLGRADTTTARHDDRRFFE